MTGEAEAAGGSVFLNAYSLPKGNAKAYIDGPIREDSQEGRLDGQLLSESLQNLEDCVELPQAVFHMTLRQWKPNPEETAARTLAEVAWNLALEPERQQIIDPDNMPPDTVQLLSRLYELTGASIVRDDLKGEETGDDGTGVVIRRGQYKGSEIYFRETYDDMPETSVYRVPDREDQRSLGIEVIGKSRGEMALLELSDSQRIELTEIIGLSKTLKFSRPDSDAGELRVPLVNRDNFEGITKLLEAAGQVAVKQAAEDMRSRNKAIRFLVACLLIHDPFELDE